MSRLGLGWEWGWVGSGAGLGVGLGLSGWVSLGGVVFVGSGSVGGRGWAGRV